MSENMKKLLEMLSGDAELQAQIAELAKINDKQGIIDFAASKGFSITMDDLADKSAKPSELSDDELDAVAGGNDGVCVCVAAGGGGGKNDYDNTFGCACVGYGQGGDAKEDHFNCLCTLSGLGGDVF